MDEKLLKKLRESVENMRAKVVAAKREHVAGLSPVQPLKKKTAAVPLKTRETDA